MLAEPTHNTRAAREKAVQVLFETQGCPALFMAKSAVLSAFAVGKQTALVVDAGYRGTTGGCCAALCVVLLGLLLRLGRVAVALSFTVHAAKWWMLQCRDNKQMVGRSNAGPLFRAVVVGGYVQ